MCATGARETRKARVAARTAAYREVKRAGDGVIVRVPGTVRARCGLSERLRKVKLFVEREDMGEPGVLKRRVREGLRGLFPEMERDGWLEGFEVRVGGGSVVRDATDLRAGLERCWAAGIDVEVEVVLRDVPEVRVPSVRESWVRETARDAERTGRGGVCMISFYRFVNVAEPDKFCERLRKVWGRMGVKGRVYVAPEGINAQLAVPEVVLKDFCDAVDGSWEERGEAVVPQEIVGVFLNTDSIVHRSAQPFEKLSIRAREKVLADGLDVPLDWNRAGREVPPEEWHKALTEKDPNAVILDCRNGYESDVGRFEGAETLNTKTFRDTWDWLESRLGGVDRSKPILTYCTGGIRCVKVNAYLEQSMGFTNTGRLEGGIVSYARSLREKGQLEESKFKGVNHVFDGRIGEVITQDILDKCINCKQPCSVQTDCANEACPRPFDKRMFVQCPECAARMAGACSAECVAVLQAQRRMHPEQLLHRATSVPMPSQKGQNQHFERHVGSSDAYADAFTTQELALLRELRETTVSRFPNRSHMLSGLTQASLLRMLVQTTGCRRVLEIGTFTGYSALYMAAGLPADGILVACELDDEVSSVARAFFQRDLKHGHKITMHGGRAMETLHSLVDEDEPPFDLIFVDADKGGYRGYYDFVLDNNLIRKGGLMIFDNVLFRGLVAQTWTGVIVDGESMQAGEDNVLARKRLKSLENARRIAGKLHEFNVYLGADARTEQVLLPLRDGITIARRIE